MSIGEQIPARQPGHVALSAHALRGVGRLQAHAGQLAGQHAGLLRRGAVE